MRRMFFTPSVVLAITVLFIGSSLAEMKPAPARFGQTFDEIVAKAKEEGTVRLATAFLGRGGVFKKTFGKKFKEMYGIDLEFEFIHGVESRERILLELVGGHIAYDLVQIVPTVIPSYYKAGVIDGPFDWTGLFGVDPAYVSPDKRMITAGATVLCFAYNPDLVPEDRVPHSWEDLLKPYYKGKFIVVTRPQAFIGLYPHWGKEKTLEYCRKLAAQNPIWMSSFDASVAGIAAGEFPMIVGIPTTDILGIQRRDPSVKLKFVIPTEVPVNAYFHTIVAKKCKSPNAALLMAGWLASPEGQVMFDTIGRRGSPMVEGTEIARMVKEAGAKVYFNSWEFTAEMAQQYSKEVIEAWGFPTPRKK